MYKTFIKQVSQSGKLFLGIGFNAPVPSTIFAIYLPKNGISLAGALSDLQGTFTGH